MSDQTTVEVTTVGTDRAVFHDGTEVHRYHGLAPGKAYELDGTEIQTLSHPGGELLCRFATVNDVHFGEVECGLIEGTEIGPVLSVEPGETPYPEMMNSAAVAEIAAVDPAAVIVKGDLTTHGTVDEYEQFLACYEPAFGDRLHHVRGNHDAYHGQDFADTAMQRIDLPGVTVALFDTAIPGKSSGRFTETQREWLEDLAAEADGMVLVFGHHHPWSPHSNERRLDYFGISPDDSERLIGAISRHPNIRGYFAGHTHRNRARRFAATGDVPYVEVACVKDYPGAWAEYEVHEGGVVQLHHRISSPRALDWTQRTRAMFMGMYADYSFGGLDDRCLVIPRDR